jgi:acetate kinase
VTARAVSPVAESAPACLEGLGALAFTGGIGETSSAIRTRNSERLGWLGVTLDATANEAGKTEISKPSSRVRVIALPADEECMLARDALRIVA